MFNSTSACDNRDISLERHQNESQRVSFVTEATTRGGRTQRFQENALKITHNERDYDPLHKELDCTANLLKKGPF